MSKQKNKILTLSLLNIMILKECTQAQTPICQRTKLGYSIWENPINFVLGSIYIDGGLEAAKGYLKADLIGPFVRSLNVYITL